MSLSEHGIYQHWSDNVARGATITVETGTNDTGYGVERLVDDEPDYVFRSPDTGVAIQITFAAKTPAEILGLIHTTLEVDEDVRIQADDDADWVSPAIDEPIDIAGWQGSGAGRWPINSWKELSAIPDWDPAGYKNYRLCFGLDTPLSQPLQIGDLWLGSEIRRFDPDVRWGVTRQNDQADLEHKTRTGHITIYPFGVNRWTQQGDILIDSQAYADALDAQWFDVRGRYLPWLLVPDGAVNRCYLVRHGATNRPVQLQFPLVSSIQLSVEELSRGVRPGV